jgi:osmotically-inducible protein OsmY
MSSHPRKLYGLTSAFILAGALTGCATYEKCGLEGCPGDAKVTANVQSLLDQHPALEANRIDVQTLDHVVYLNGMVATGLESSEAATVAGEAPGVTRVVNLLAVSR